MVDKKNKDIAFDMERSYLQLVRMSDEVQHELTEHKQLVYDSYAKYLVQAQKLLAEWQISAEKSKPLYQKQTVEKDFLERISHLKERFMRNMRSVKIRLEYLHPMRLYCDRAKMLQRKFVYYLTEMEKSKQGQMTRSSPDEIKNELVVTRKSMQLLLSDSMEGDNIDAIKKEMQALIDRHILPFEKNS
ncbi:MAG: hypothetical protein K9M07_00080 [Simkaniaceae bacterium]|nr:hypothetical protein [Simkaniaceae bacterium]